MGRFGDFLSLLAAIGLVGGFLYFAIEQMPNQTNTKTTEEAPQPDLVDQGVQERLQQIQEDHRRAYEAEQQAARAQAARPSAPPQGVVRVENDDGTYEEKTLPQPSDTNYPAASNSNAQQEAEQASRIYESMQPQQQANTSSNNWNLAVELDEHHCDSLTIGSVAERQCRNSWKNALHNLCNQTHNEISCYRDRKFVAVH